MEVTYGGGTAAEVTYGGGAAAEVTYGDGAAVEVTYGGGAAVEVTYGGEAAAEVTYGGGSRCGGEPTAAGPQRETTQGGRRSQCETIHGGSGLKDRVAVVAVNPVRYLHE